MIKTDGHGTIRKVKGGAVGVIALSTLMLGMNSVSADGPVVPTTVNSVVNTNSTNGEVSKEVPKNTDKEVYKKVENNELKPAVSDAKNKGVQVTEESKPIIKDSETEANKAVTDQLNHINEAKKLQETGVNDLVSNKEKLKAANLDVVDGGTETFTDLSKMKEFLDNQNKSSNTDVESKRSIDNTIKVLTKELTDVGLEVTVGPKVLKENSTEALAAVKDLQNKVTASVNTKNELNKSFTNLKNLANSVGLVVKDDKIVKFDDATSAKNFLTNQINELNSLVDSLNKENAKLDDAVNVAKTKGISVSKNPNVTVNSTTDLVNSISQQVNKLQNLVKAVDESKTLIDNSTAKAKESGLVLEGDTVVSLNKTEDVSKLKEKVQNAIRDLDEATKVQTSTKSEFDKLVADARAKGLEITISGDKNVSVSGVSTELESIKSNINKALSDKNKAQSDYNAAVANLKEANRLADKSSANKEGDVYKNTVTIKSEGTSGVVNIKTTGSAELVSFELFDPTGAKIDMVKTLDDLSNFTNFNKKGDYILNYVFRAKDNSAGKITVSGQTQGTNSLSGKTVGNANFMTKAPVVTSTTSEIEPLITDHVYDYSSSYSAKIKDSLRLSKKIIEQNKNPNSRHILQLYPDNYGQTSYHANTHNFFVEMVGLSTRLLTKEEALSVIDNLLEINAPNEDDPTNTNWIHHFKSLAKALGEYRYLNENSSSSVPFEDIVTELTKPTDTISVIQYTDGWMDSGAKKEVMDQSFANWAKGRAKTFMSVINRNKVFDEDTNTMQSINEMQALGHPNIYDMTGKDPSVVTEEVLERFMETATVRVQSSRGENQSVSVSINGDNVEVVRATLRGPIVKNLPVVNGSVDFSEELPDGDWSIDYELSGDGTANISVSVAGKNVVNDMKTLKATKAISGHTVSSVNDIVAVDSPVLSKPTGMTIENVKVTAKNVKLGQIETDYATVSVNKEFSKANFKETVSPISFKHISKKAKADVTLNDVYFRTLFEKGVPEVLNDLPEYHEQKGSPEVHKKEQKQVIAYFDVEDGALLDDNTTKELPKTAPQTILGGEYVFTGKFETIDGITKYYYKKVVKKPTYKPKTVLPKTSGENNSTLSMIGGSMVLSVLGVVGLKKKKEA